MSVSFGRYVDPYSSWRIAFTVGLIYRPIVYSGGEPEGRIVVGDQKECLALHSESPPHDALDKVAEFVRIAAGEEDDEPGQYHSEHRCSPKEEQDDVMRDGE
jgi:hypothetical protein